MRVTFRQMNFAIVAAAAMALAGCQAGGAPTPGPGPRASIPAGTAAGLPPPPPPGSVTVPREAVAAGLSVYKVYNTTEALCRRTCQAEGRCQQHTFQPISTINGYVAGQCQLLGR